MKQYWNKNRRDLLLAAGFAVFALISVLLRFDYGLRAVAQFRMSLLEMISFIPLIFILIGLIEVWVPREIIQRHLGHEAGIRGVLWVVLLAMLQAGPLYGAFPVALMLWRKGCSVRNIFVYLGAFSTMKLPMLSFEIGFLGLEFSLIRTALSVPVFYLIAWIMEKWFGRHFAMKDPHHTE